MQQEEQVKEEQERKQEQLAGAANTSFAAEGESTADKPIDLVGDSGDSSDSETVESVDDKAADDDLPAFGTLESRINNVNEVIPPPLPHCRYPIHHRYPTAATHTHPPPLPHCRYPHPSTTATPVPLPPPTALPHRNCHPPHHRVGQRISTPKVTLLLALSPSSLKIR